MVHETRKTKTNDSNHPQCDETSLRPGDDGARPRRINRWTTVEDLDASPWFRVDGEGDLAEVHEAARAALARAGQQAGQVWLWCLHCSRFFQAKDLVVDFLDNWERCPFDDCGAAGLDVDILTWDAYKADDPRWPGSVDELRFGLRV